MADEQLIKPRELPAATTVFADDAIMTDNGSIVGKATPVQIVNAGAPVPTEAEAIAGSDNSKRMTPLTVKQVLDSVTAPSVMRAAAWAESNTPPDPAIPGSKSAKSWASESERLGREQADRAEAAADRAELHGRYQFVDADDFFNYTFSESDIGQSCGSLTNSAWHLTELGGGDFDHPKGAVGVKVVYGDRGFNIRDFGAVGDGVADDTVAIQLAIDAIGSTMPPSNNGFSDLAPVNAKVYAPSGKYKTTKTLVPNHNFVLTGDGLGTHFVFDPSSPNSDFIQPKDNTIENSGLRGSNIGLFFSDFIVSVASDGGVVTGRNGSPLSTVNSNSRHAFNFINGSSVRFKNVFVISFQNGTAFRFSTGAEEGRPSYWAFYNVLEGCFTRNCKLGIKPTSATQVESCFFSHTLNFPAQSRMSEYEYMIDTEGSRGCSFSGSVEGYAAVALIRDNGAGHSFDGLYTEAFPPTPMTFSLEGLPSSALSVSHGALSYGYTYATGVDNLIARTGNDNINVGMNFGFGDCRELEIYHSASGQSPSFRDGLPGRGHFPAGGTLSVSTDSFVGETAMVLARGASSGTTHNALTYTWKVRGGRKLLSNIWVTCLVKFGGNESPSTVLIQNSGSPSNANFKRLVVYPNGYELWGTYLTPGEDQTFTFLARQNMGSTDPNDTLTITAIRAWINGFDPILAPWQWPEYRSAAPTAGNWLAGEFVRNSAPTVVSDKVITGWLCVVAGTPGTWVPIYAATV